MKAGALLGSTVRDRNGREIGSVEGVITDRITGRVSFAVVALTYDDVVPDSDVLPVPRRALAATSDRALRLQIDKRRVTEAPSIPRDELDALDRRDTMVEVFCYYGVQPPWEGRERC